MGILKAIEIVEAQLPLLEIAFARRETFTPTREFNDAVARLLEFAKVKLS